MFHVLLGRADEILAHNNSGPSGILAYTWANAARVVECEGRGGNYTYAMPYVDTDSSQALKPYFAVVKTNRTGIEVAVLPGGTQDIIFDLDGKEQYAELVKPEKQRRFLREKLGIAIEEIEEIDDQIFVAALLSTPKITNLRLEPAFSAAVRETREEHGWGYDQNKGKILSSSEVDETLLSKRSFKTSQPVPVSQKIFVVCVSDFEGVVPVRNDKIESKIESMLGSAFYEQGDFMSLPGLEAQLKESGVRLKRDNTLPDIAKIDYQATVSRVAIVRRISRGLPSLKT